jgi:type I restriction enzyme S subunit
MNWDKKTLGEIYEIEGGSVQTGPFGSQLHEADYTEFGVPVIMPKDIIDDKLDLSGIAHISEDDAKRLSQHIVKKNDIICPRRGEIGKRIIIEDDNVGAFCGTGCIRLRGTGTVLNQLFFFYFLKQPNVVKWIENQAIGATMMNLNTSILKSIPVKYPPLPIQQKIASILSAYDELIENNKQRIKLLEEMAEEIYKEWFVRLRFPNYENTEFVDGLPKGWENGKVEDFFKTSSGGTPSRQKESEYYGGAIDWIKTGELKDTFIQESEEKITEIGLKNSSAKLFPPNTLLMAMYGVNIGQLGISVKASSANQAVCVFTPIHQNRYSLFYSFFFFKSIRTQLFNMSMGAAQQNLSQEIIKRINFTQPTADLLNSFNKIQEPLFEEIKLLQQKNQLLQQTRDLLLPRLISGKLSVEGLAEAKEYVLGQNAEPWPMAVETEGGYHQLGGHNN